MKLQADLFAAPEGWQYLELRDAQVRLYPGWLDPSRATRLFSELHSTLPWESGELRLHGKRVPIPRRFVWFGDQDRAYTYSGKLHAARPLPPVLQRLREQLSAEIKRPFNSVLCNLYRTGQDSVALHSDDETELGLEPCIASLSLGASRRFLMRHKEDKSARLQLELHAGDLLVMAGPCQQHWQHGIPKTARKVGPRINLTFREIR